jgi:hypothetical protein
MGPIERPMSEAEARALPGVKVYDLTHKDGRHEARIIAQDGEDLLAYDFERNGWERIPGMANACILLEDRWRKIREVA